MTYEKCPDCRSVGRYHYAHCKLGGPPRTEVVEAAPVRELDSLERVEAEMDAAEPGEVIVLPAGMRPGDVVPRRKHDAVNHPLHYTQGQYPVECIDIVEHLNFCRGNAVKYIWRAGDKGNEIEDLKKARWYLDREISRLEKSA